jgi:hypothetical protein
MQDYRRYELHHDYAYYKARQINADTTRYRTLRKKQCRNIGSIVS